MSGSKKIYPTHAGDIFMIPTKNDRNYIGQIIDNYYVSLYVVVFDFVVPAAEAPNRAAEALQAKPLFASLTSDARLRPGMWSIIGNQPSDKNRFLPAFRFGDSGLDGVKIENFKGTQTRLATPEEIKLLHARSIRSAMILEKAARFKDGLEDKVLPSFEEISIPIPPLPSIIAFPE